MTDVNDLATWLRQQLDDDERALYLAGGTGARWPHPGFRWLIHDIDAKRRILDEVVDEATGLDMQVDSEFRVGSRDEVAEPYLGDVLVRLLALPYANREGYREEWKP